jgi:DNA-binding transcriptional MerR regulator
MNFEELNIDFEKMQELLAKDAVGLENYLDRYISRRFYIGNTRINRKTLKDWENNGLLPYIYLEEGWRKFSFLEWVWLECILELRNLGVSLEKIKEIKQRIFDVNPDDVFRYFKERLSAHTGEFDRKDEIIGFYQQELSDDQKRQWVESLQISSFFIYLLITVLKDMNLCLAYNNNGFCSFFVMGKVDEDMQASNASIVSNIINESFVVLNLRKIVNTIFEKPDLKNKGDFVIDFLSKNERKIFEEIRSSNAKEIVITFDKESEPTHIRVNRNTISKETLNKVARYLKQGKYQTIEFTTRNGKLIKYGETDVIKLDK